MSEKVASKRLNSQKSAKDTATALETAKKALETAKSATDGKELKEPPTTNSWFYLAQDYFIAFLLLVLACIQYLLYLASIVVETLYDCLVKAYRVGRFCYEKPKHAKEIFYTTLHLMNVSYDAGLWTFSDMYQIMAGQLGVMVRTPASTPPTTEVTRT